MVPDGSWGFHIPAVNDHWLKASGGSIEKWYKGITGDLRGSTKTLHAFSCLIFTTTDTSQMRKARLARIKSLPKVS